MEPKFILDCNSHPVMYFLMVQWAKEKCFLNRPSIITSKEGHRIDISNK